VTAKVPQSLSVTAHLLTGSGHLPDQTEQSEVQQLFHRGRGGEGYQGQD